jgi:FkbM family methyltransferase
MNKIFRKIAQIYGHQMWKYYGLIGDTITKRTMQGVLTMSTHDNGIAIKLYRDRQYEYDSSVRAIKFLKSARLIPAESVTMLDIGANIGFISVGLILSGFVDRAVAIEPNPFNYKLLTKNVAQNGLANKMLCLEISVGEKNDTLMMELSLNNAGDHRIRSATATKAREIMQESLRKTVQVKCLPISEIVMLTDVIALGVGKPSFVWIDIQGYEGYAFKGGASILRDGIPAVTEIWPYGIMRSGMALEEFHSVVSAIWTDYWIERRNRYVKYPIGVFDRFLNEIGTDGYFENVIFTKA